MEILGSRKDALEGNGYAVHGMLRYETSLTNFSTSRATKKNLHSFLPLQIHITYKTVFQSLRESKSLQVLRNFELFDNSEYTRIESGPNELFFSNYRAILYKIVPFETDTCPRCPNNF